MDENFIRIAYFLGYRSMHWYNQHHVWVLPEAVLHNSDILDIEQQKIGCEESKYDWSYIIPALLKLKNNPPKNYSFKAHFTDTSSSLVIMVQGTYSKVQHIFSGNYIAGISNEERAVYAILSYIKWYIININKDENYTTELNQILKIAKSQRSSKKQLG